MGIEAQLLSVIAAATVVIAVVQLGFFAYGVRVARRISRLTEVVEREIRPALGRVDAISADAARAAALAVAQVERVDRVFGRFAAGADEAVTAARESVVEPVRQGGAFLAGLRAALLAFRNAGGAPPDGAPGRRPEPESNGRGAPAG